MTLTDTSRAIVSWRTVYSKVLDRHIQVRRPCIRDTQKAETDIWLSLVRDGDGTPLFAAGTDTGEVLPALVEEVCALSLAIPTQGGAPSAS